jgi:MFS family permease
VLGESTTYPALFRIPAFPRLAASVLLARTASQMMQLALVLFVLQRFHSPSLAGLTVFLAIAPGILVSPVAGALLDRHGRVRLITLDYLVGALTLAAIVSLDVAGQLRPAVLLSIVTVGALTYSLSNSGARSLLPLVVPKRLWDRANALDSIAYAVTIGAGPALAGALTAWSGSRIALAATAILYLLAALALLRLPEPLTGRPAESMLSQAWAGVVYVIRANPTLRGIVLVMSLMNLGMGILVVAVPVMVFGRLHGSAALAGALWAVFGFATVPSALIAGRIDSRHRELTVMVLATLVTATGVAILALAVNPWVAIGAMLLAGLSIGPFDVSMFSMRQRRTDPTWYGRAFAVSMGMNWAGQPIGSALSGPLIQLGISLTFVISAALIAGSAGLMRLVIPAEDPGRIPAESARQSRRDRPVEESPSSAEQGAG